MQGWDGSHRGGVGHAGVGWVIQGWGRSQRGWVGHAGVGRSCCSGEDHAGVGWGGASRGGWVMHRWGQVGHTEGGWGGS